MWLFLVEGASENKTLNDTEKKKIKNSIFFLMLCLQKSAGDDLRAEKLQLLLHGHTPEYPWIWLITLDL